MENEQVKEMLYEHLASLNKEHPDRYFSLPRIFEYMKGKLREKGIIVGNNRRGSKDGKEIDLDGILPHQNTLRPNIEQLVEEGKVEQAIIEAASPTLRYRIGSYQLNRYYRVVSQENLSETEDQ